MRVFKGLLFFPPSAFLEAPFGVFSSQTPQKIPVLATIGLNPTPNFNVMKKVSRRSARAQALDSLFFTTSSFSTVARTRHRTWHQAVEARHYYHCCSGGSSCSLVEARRQAERLDCSMAVAGRVVGCGCSSHRRPSQCLGVARNPVVVDDGRSSSCGKEAMLVYTTLWERGGEMDGGATRKGCSMTMGYLDVPKANEEGESEHNQTSREDPAAPDPPGRIEIVIAIVVEVIAAVAIVWSVYASKPR